MNEALLLQGADVDPVRVRIGGEAVPGFADERARTHMQTPAYGTLLTKLGQDTRWITVSRGDRTLASWLVFVGPLDFQRPPALLVSRAVDRHLHAVHGPVLDPDLDPPTRALVRDASLAALRRMAARLRPVTVTARLDPMLDDDAREGWVRAAQAGGWHADRTQTWAALLPADEEEMFRRISRERRTKVRKAERGGGTIDVRADGEALREYYDVRCETFARNDIPAIGWPHFISTLEALSPAGVMTILLARFGDRVGAAQLAFAQRGYVVLVGVAVAGWALADRRPANDLLQWGVLRWAIAQGHQVVDFVGANSGSSDPKLLAIDAFKSRWGTSLHDSLTLSILGSRARAVAAGVARRMPFE